ncbi:alpha/beta hydrolase [Roseiarcaceae bacterium H3SJ34-1]|uniref:alpha/beta hydrolase n=1 Tax=Terripilifer ovatus TaxID=3032367 RepID=UPI003AB985F2|nr:alpha/beta hydrolase [Roseiarcaceae bacterium H3SJ34-1]
MLRFPGGLLAACVLLGGLVYIAFRTSPWPSAMIVRFLFDKQAQATAAALEKHVPKGVAARIDEPYDPADTDAKLDVFYPAKVEGTATVLPTIVWVHGGAWLSGNKSHVANYLRILAANGYTVVGVDYSLAPAATYPTPVRQVNAALAYLHENAGRLHVDRSRFFLAGDSAGAQIAAQLANLISVPSYASEVGIVPAIARPQLRGVVLHCGIYDVSSLDLDGSFGDFLWSYIGKKNFLNEPASAQLSVARYVTPDFPPTFISGGNGDPLTPQSRQMAEAVASKGVHVDSLFYPGSYMPAVPHEYQFNLDIAAGRQALEQSMRFVAAQSK